MARRASRSGRSWAWAALIAGLGLAAGAGLYRWTPSGRAPPLRTEIETPPPAVTRLEAHDVERPASPSPPDADADAERPGRGVAPAPRLHPRAEGEWQGMRVDLSIAPLCADSAGCGLGLACQEGRCGPCSTDGDCAGGEACVLDHCVPAAQVACRSASECETGALCVLSGYSSDPRGNEEMHAFCLSPEGGDETAGDRAPLETVPDEPRPVSIEALRRALEEDAQTDAPDER